MLESETQQISLIYNNYR